MLVDFIVEATEYHETIRSTLVKIDSLNASDTNQPPTGDETMKITGRDNRINLTVDGKRCGITIASGPWIEGVNPALIKLRPKKNIFPREFLATLTIEDNSDGRADYFEPECVRLLPGHPLYAAAKAAA